MCPTPGCRFVYCRQCWEDIEVGIRRIAGWEWLLWVTVITTLPTSSFHQIIVRRYASGVGVKIQELLGVYRATTCVLSWRTCCFVCSVVATRVDTTTTGRRHRAVTTSTCDAIADTQRYKSRQIVEYARTLQTYYMYVITSGHYCCHYCVLLQNLGVSTKLSWTKVSKQFSPGARVSSKQQLLSSNIGVTWKPCTAMFCDNKRNTRVYHVIQGLHTRAMLGPHPSETHRRLRASHNWFIHECHLRY